MKKMLKKIMVGVMFLIIGYNVAKLFTPQKAFALKISLPGKEGYYNGLHICVCPRVPYDCVCVIDL